MPFDPFSTVLAAALYAPIAFGANKWRPTGATEGKHAETTELDIPLMGQDVPTAWTMREGTSPMVADRLTAISSEVQGYAGLVFGWDGPESAGPSSACVEAAARFVRSIPPGLPLPVPMVSSAGEIGFYWNEEGGYGDINFDAEGTASFFSRASDGSERFMDGLSVAGLDRAWFFDALGDIAAPAAQAA